MGEKVHEREQRPLGQRLIQALRRKLLYIMARDSRTGVRFVTGSEIEAKPVWDRGSELCPTRHYTQ